MRLTKTVKTVDYKKLNIGTELEALIIDSADNDAISQKQSQEIFHSLINDQGWEATVVKQSNGEIQGVSKKLDGVPTDIKLDFCYNLFELSTPSPVKSLEDLKKVHQNVIGELKKALKKHGFGIYPYGAMPEIKKPTLIDDPNLRTFERIDYMPRFCHIASHQVNVDVPLAKIIPMMNALYKHLGMFITKFGNSPLEKNGKKYREGRHYYWTQDIPKQFANHRITGGMPVFPEEPFRDLHHFFDHVWHGSHTFVIRNGIVHTFKKADMTTHEFLRQKKAVCLLPDGTEVSIELNFEDIEGFLHMHWLDFKPHFDLKPSATLENFLEAYNSEKLNDWMKLHTYHTYIEIRCISPHWENYAMAVPRYFYDIAQNMDWFIQRSEKITWEEARMARDKAIYLPDDAVIPKQSEVVKQLLHL